MKAAQGDEVSDPKIKSYDVKPRILKSKIDVHKMKLDNNHIICLNSLIELIYTFGQITFCYRN